MTGFTQQGNRIAEGIQSGDIGINILGDGLFDRYYQQLGGTDIAQAFQLGDQIYLRRGSPNLLSDIIHEGTHVLDEFNGTVTIPYNVNPYPWEKRAFFFERQFQRASNGRVEFETVQEMVDFIYREYP